MYPKCLSIFLFYVCDSLIFGVEAASQMDTNQVITLLAHITKIQPSSDEIHLNEADPLELECTGFKNVTFIHPHNYYNIPLSPMKIEYRYIDGMYKAIFKRKNTVYGDTGWYGCVDFDKLSSSRSWRIALTPDNFNKSDVKWVYVYVKSKKQAFHNNIGKYTTIYGEIGDDLLLNCRVNSPDYDVMFFYEDKRLDIKNERMSYNPRKGLLIKNVTVEDSGLYQCYNHFHYNTVNFVVHVTKKLADMYNPVISKPDETELIIGEELKLKCTVEIAYGTTYSFGWTTPHESDRISFNGYQLGNGTETFVLVKELIIEKTRSEDQGEYVCTVSTAKKTNSAKINVQLKKPPPMSCYNKKDLSSAIAGLKDSILNEIKSSLEDIIINAVEKSVSKNIELNLGPIKSKLEQFF